MPGVGAASVVKADLMVRSDILMRKIKQLQLDGGALDKDIARLVDAGKKGEARATAALAMSKRSEIETLERSFRECQGRLAAIKETENLAEDLRQQTDTNAAMATLRPDRDEVVQQVGLATELFVDVKNMAKLLSNGAADAGAISAGEGDDYISRIMAEQGR
jgi:hypothetical protein